MAQETYKIPQVQWWGLPVGVVLTASAIAATMYANLGINDMTTNIVGIIALPVLACGITGLGAFIYSIIARGVSRTEAKNYIPDSAH